MHVYRLYFFIIAFIGTHQIYNNIKNGIYNFIDEKFNNIAHAFNKVPYEKRTLGKLFTTALINNPSLKLVPLVGAI